MQFLQVSSSEAQKTFALFMAIDYLILCEYLEFFFRI